MYLNELFNMPKVILKNKPSNNIHIAVITNISFEPYFTPLLIKQFFDANDFWTVINQIPYNEMSTYEYKEDLERADLIVICLNFNSLFPFANYNDIQLVDYMINQSKTLIEKISMFSNAKIIWILFEDYYSKDYVVLGHNYSLGNLIDKINYSITDNLQDRISFIDLKHIIAQVGIGNAYNTKGKYRWNAPYSKALVNCIVKEIHKQYLIEKGITKKCLVLDADNVLWGGILSEDGVENLKISSSGLGKSFQDFQKFILSLYDCGIILAICSKNDISDILTMFREHDEMILKENHIACFMVNWENKPDNIRRISDALNIGLDSIVFVDDSIVEIEAVKAMLPEVTTIIYERDLIYEQLSCFNLRNNISKANIEKRTETYRTNHFREALKSKYDNYKDYLNALETKLDIHKATQMEISRISELTQRTNKCTNGVRYTVPEIKDRFFAKNITLYSVCVSDRFSNLGLVGALEIEGNMLTLFSLSCRALGREVETMLIEFIAGKHQISEIKFKTTQKNDILKKSLLKAFPNANLCSF